MNQFFVKINLWCRKRKFISFFKLIPKFFCWFKRFNQSNFFPQWRRLLTCVLKSFDIHLLIYRFKCARIRLATINYSPLFHSIEKLFHLIFHVALFVLKKNLFDKFKKKKKLWCAFCCWTRLINNFISFEVIRTKIIWF
jgi:hypothetical protein